MTQNKLEPIEEFIKTYTETNGITFKISFLKRKQLWKFVESNSDYAIEDETLEGACIKAIKYIKDNRKATDKIVYQFGEIL